MASELVDAFARCYGVSPTVLVHAPGRVNLIGEHTDYSLLPVLPMAIGPSVIVAGGLGRPGKVEVDSLALPAPVTVDGSAKLTELSGWHRYVAAAVSAAGGPGGGARLLVGGDLPHQGGLGSSSAMTLGVLAALGELWSHALDRAALIDGAATAERSTGVEGGTMDQTVIVRASEGAALRIDFDPLRTKAVPIPGDLGLVVAYSGHPAPKGAEVLFEYNRLVVACRAAAACLGAWAGMDSGLPPVLGKVAAASEVEDLVRRLPDRISAESAARKCGVSLETLVALTAGGFDPGAHLPIRAAAEHVLSEAHRVDSAEKALASGDLNGFGRKLDQSHASLVKLGVSTPGLDRLVEAMREAGAYGSRLTGAGFGGHALAACPIEAVPVVVATAERAAGGPGIPVAAADGLSISAV